MTSLKKARFHPWVKLGKKFVIDENVVLGYKPYRKIRELTLIVGDNCRIRYGTVIYGGSKIGNNLETGHNVIIREGNVIGNNFSIWSNSVVDYECNIGNNVKVHSNCYIAQYTSIEDDVFLSPGTMIANDIHPGCKFFRECMKGPTLRRGVKVGVNVTILPFITIGENSLIGAGSVVTKNIPSNCVAYGHPARVMKSLDELKCVKGLTDKPY